MKNQYFKFIFQDESAFLHFYPPSDGGKKVKINEVTEYLNLKRYNQYDIKQLHAAIEETEKETDVFVGPWDGIKIHETLVVEVSLDKMKAIARFYPPSEDGNLLDEEEIVDSLSFRRVKYGIEKEEIQNFLKNREYCTDYILAKGLQPRHGTDAKIVYHFNTDRNLQPKRNEDGSVDYKELNTISHVHAGDELATLIREDPGECGKNVYGEEIRPRTVKTLKLEYGNNITMNEDGTKIFSDVTGHVILLNNKVFVSNVYEVPADVDNSIGNIEYEGSVLVKGNVNSGFSIKATGDIIVEGVVEGAYLESQGQIILKRGVHGMHKAVINAGTNLMAKFIENATVTAGGYVEAEIVMNCDVSANSMIRISGRKGLINGGTLRAGIGIEAENIGTEMGTFTRLEVGIDPAQKKRYSELSKEVAIKSKELEDTKVIVNNYGAILKRGEHLPQDKLMYVQKLAISCKKQQAEIEPLREEMRKIHMEMMASEHSYVAVKKTVFQGVNIAISDMEYSVKSKNSYCRFKKMDGCVKAVPL